MEDRNWQIMNPPRPLTPEEIDRGFDYDSVDPEYHPADCTCIFCIPGE
jgi:hypothetical protein